MSRHWWVLALLMGLVWAGCRTVKPVAGELRPMRAKELLRHASANEFKFETLSARTRIEFANAEGGASFRADLRMKHDSAIWVSIKPALGLEVARVLITPDTIKIQDRLKKQYIVQPFSYMQQMFDVPVTFALLQQMITGELLVSEPRHAESGIEGGQYTLQYEADSMHHRLWLNPEHFTIARLLVSDLTAPRTIEVAMKDFQMVEGQWFAMDRYLKAVAGEMFTMQMVFSRVRLNEALNFTFQVGDNYEVVD